MFVSDAFDLHLYSSTRDLLELDKAGASNKHANFFGFPDYGAKGLLTALPGTKTEIDAVSQITRSKGYSINTYMEQEASEENFKRMRSPCNS